MKVLNFIFLIFISALLNSCVSVKLGADKVIKAKGIAFKAPPAPFESVDHNSTDEAWQSSNTGNLIAFQTECSQTNDPKLETIENESLAALDSLEHHESKEVLFKNRQANLLYAKGKVDGVNVSLYNLIFKRNGCIYILSYSGLSSKIQMEQSIFEQFKKDFEVP